MSKITAFILLIFCGGSAFAQNKPEFSGQVSAIGNLSPKADYFGLFGGRYIPELSYLIQTDSTKTLDFEASANISGSVLFNGDSSIADVDVQPYRMWARYAGEQFEVRLGLQKIDFGSASILRPMQWFNQIDPRDPLQLTNGVYAALGRYYFLNNANIWLWSLYGNGKTRGFDAVQTYQNHPEFGGRFQHPVKKGEIAVSYHHRTSDASKLTQIPSFEKIPEDRFGIDGKWDVKIGLWFEATHVRKSENVGILTNQTLLNVGADYTFGVGNGLNVIGEHLILSYDEKAFDFSNTANISAAIISYPIGIFDNLSSVFYYNWATDDYVAFMNYQHQFKHFTGYVMAFYNSGNQDGIQDNDLLNLFSGPGFRIMAVYNH